MPTIEQENRERVLPVGAAERNPPKRLENFAIRGGFRSASPTLTATGATRCQLFAFFPSAENAARLCIAVQSGIMVQVPEA